jgi:hypothetical protein
MEPVLERLDPLVTTRLELSREEFDALVAFVRDGLLDAREACAPAQARAPTRAERQTDAHVPVSSTKPKTGSTTAAEHGDLGPMTHSRQGKAARLTA